MKDETHHFGSTPMSNLVFLPEFDSDHWNNNLAVWHDFFSGLFSLALSQVVFWWFILQLWSWSLRMTSLVPSSVASTGAILQLGSRLGSTADPAESWCLLTPPTSPEQAVMSTIQSILGARDFRKSCSTPATEQMRKQRRNSYRRDGRSMWDFTK